MLKDTRGKGDLAEAKFLVKAYQLGLFVSIPWNDRPYDFIVENKQGLIKLQIKSCHKITVASRNRTRYKCGIMTGYNKYRCYSHSDIDFLLVLIVPEDIWYILPVDFLKNKKGIAFYPHINDSKSCSEVYKENWKILLDYGVKNG